MKRIFFALCLAAIIFTFKVDLVAAQNQVDRNLDNTAQDTCTCFCKSATGASDQGEKADANACRDVCQAKDNYYLGCYQNPDQFPQNNKLCWTEADCLSADSISDFQDLPAGSDWGGQEPICPSNMGYCYNKVSPIKIGVAINSVSEVSSFNQYIALIYAYLLPAAALLAVIMMMVGGLEWMLAHGRQEAIGKAKTRITNAIIGLVILLAAYSIAYLIDPALVNWNELRLPRVREITFLDFESSCEALVAQGVEVTPLGSKEECGYKGRIDSMDALGQNIVSTVKVGDECLYQGCEELATCVSTPNTVNKFSCLRCLNASEVIENVTQSDCSRLVHQATDEEMNLEKHFYCEYDVTLANECVEIVYPTFTSPAADSLNCRALRQVARDAGSESCRAYDLVGVRRSGVIYGENIVELDSFLSATSNTAIPTTQLLTKICNEDPCNLAPPGQSSCIVWGTYSEGWVDCVDRGFYDQIEQAALEPNSFSRSSFDILGSYQITDANGDPAEFNPSW